MMMTSVKGAPLAPAASGWARPGATPAARAGDAAAMAGISPSSNKLTAQLTALKNGICEQSFAVPHDIVGTGMKQFLSTYLAVCAHEGQGHRNDLAWTSDNGN